MTKEIKFDNICKYTDLKLCELELLNEVRSQIQEMCVLRDKGVEGVDIDQILNEIQTIYKDMLDKARRCS
jgi:hypothetical protein